MRYLKFSTLFLILTCACNLLSAQSSAASSEPYLFANLADRYTKRTAEVEMRDGVKLHTIIVEPKDKSCKHPIMMERTCYSATDKTVNLRVYAPYVDNDYIFVFQDVRGKCLSEGVYEDMRPFVKSKQQKSSDSSAPIYTDEATDTYDTVEWLMANVENHNERVGVKGISYPGFYSTMAALSGHPAIKAVSPQAPATDWFHGDDVHHNGAFMMSEIFAFIYACESNYNNNPEIRKAMKEPHLVSSDIYTSYLKIATFENALQQFGDYRFFLDSVKAHPNWDSYWESHTVTCADLSGIKPATMLVGGLFDKEDCYGTFALYKEIRKQSPSTELYLVEGPWFHGAWTRRMGEFWGPMYFGEEGTEEYYFKNIEYPFFAWYLEDKGSKPQEGALIFDSGSRKMVRYSKGWPEVEVKDCTPFYLNDNGTVSTQKPMRESVVNYTSDPAHPVPYRSVMEKGIDKIYMIDDQRFAAQRPDVLCFQTEPLEKDITLVGEIGVELWVDISTTDADFIVKVIDVFPDDFTWEKEIGSEVMSGNFPVAGYQLLLRGEVFRGKYRESFSNPKPFVPGEKTLVKFTMPDISHTIKAGHRLMIQVQSSWFPLVDRNPQKFCNIYECKESDYIKSEIGIHCGGDGASLIRLPLKK